eukprot:COSAG01_NODE_18403_length_1078_cov_1.269663_2_plen_236_part_01
MTALQAVLVADHAARLTDSDAGSLRCQCGRMPPPPQSGTLQLELMLRAAALCVATVTACAAATPVAEPVNVRASFRGSSSGAANSVLLQLEWERGLAPGDVGFAHVQTRYQLRTRCAAGPPQLINGAGAAPRHIASPGELGVETHASCAVAVRVWDGAGRASNFSAETTFPSLPAAFAPGWITEPGAQEDAKTTLLRKAFRAGAKPTSAVVSVSGLGHYELSLNGERVGDHVMDPG